MLQHFLIFPTGGLELASLDSIPNNLIVNAAVLGTFSLVVAALFLIDLMGPRIYTATHHSQTDPFSSPKVEKKVSIATQPAQSVANGPMANGKTNGHVTGDKERGDVPERPKDLDLEKNKPDAITKKDESALFGRQNLGYTKFDEVLEKDELETSKFGSLRNGIEGGNYVHLSDPLFEFDRFQYEQELARFNEKYFERYLETIDGRLPVKEDYLPELQTPVFAKVKTGRLKSLYDDVSPNYEQKRQSRSPSRTPARTVATPTLQQLEDYLRSSNKSKKDSPALFPMAPIVEKEGTEVEGRASGTPTDPGYVQYTAGKWPDKREVRTPRHSPK